MGVAGAGWATNLSQAISAVLCALYIWLKTPDRLSSWKFFDKLLYEVNIVGTPGVGFGPSGEGFLRLTAIGDRDDTMEAMARLKKWLL